MADFDELKLISDFVISSSESSFLICSQFVLESPLSFRAGFVFDPLFAPLDCF